MGCLPDRGFRGMASCGAVSMGTTDEPARMRNGMIQINAAARLPPKEFVKEFVQ